MDDYDSIDWEEVKRKLKIWKIKTRRGLHNFDQKYKVSHNFKRAVLFLALKVAASVSSGGQVAAQNNIPSSETKLPQTELLAEAKPSLPAEEVSWAMLDEYINERERSFAENLSHDLTDNINAVAKGKKQGRKTATLKKLFGGLNPRYYCAISGLKTIENLSKKQDFFEYDFLLKCIKNPHYCPSVIEGLASVYGDNCRTTNIRKTLKEEQERNKNSVFIVLVDSKINTSSGKHFVIVTPEFAADSVAYVDDNEHLQVYGFNSEVIQDVEKYFVGTRNRGHVFNLTEMGRDKLIELYYSGKIRLEDVRIKQEELVHYEPVSLKSKAKVSGVAVNKVTRGTR